MISLCRNAAVGEMERARRKIKNHDLYRRINRIGIVTITPPKITNEQAGKREAVP
jgi:hypothetical protein